MTLEELRAKEYKRAYMIIMAKDTQELEISVNFCIENGYIPIGGIFHKPDEYPDGIFYQVVILKNLYNGE